MAKVGGGADQLSAAIQAIGFAAIPAGIALAGLATAAMTAQLAMGPVGWTSVGRGSGHVGACRRNDLHDSGLDQ